MNDEALVRHALELLHGDIAYLIDAQQGAPVSNSVVGGVMAITLNIPRQNAEWAVREALRTLKDAGVDLPKPA